MFAVIEYLIGSSLLVLSILYLYCKLVCYKYWQKRGIYCPPASFPLGHTTPVVMGKNYAGICFAEMYKHGRAKGLKHFGLYSVTKPVYVPLDPDILKHILVKDFSSFMDRGFFINHDVDPLSGHLFSLEGQQWKDLRTKLSPTFTSGKMKMMFSIVKSTADEMVNLLDEFRVINEPIDLKDILSRFTTDVIGSCAFGLECSSLKNPRDKFRKMCQKVFDPTTYESIKIFYATSYSTILKMFNMRLNNKEVADFFMDLTKNVVDYRETNNIKRNDFLQILINLKNNKNVIDDNIVNATANADNNSSMPPALTIEQIAAQTFVFFVAGYETSSSTMAFCLYELAKNPDIQNRLRNEIKNILKPTNGEITYDVIITGGYLDMVVSETLRKYPTLGHLTRKCNKRSQIPGTDLIIEEDNRVIIPVYGIHHDPEYYPDPDLFDPERFNEENKAKRPTFTYLPFGEGPRICIGMRFGMMQVKIGLMSILYKYKLSLHRKTVEPLQFNSRSFVLCTKYPIYLNLIKD